MAATRCSYFWHLSKAEFFLNLFLFQEILLQYCLPSFPRFPGAHNICFTNIEYQRRKEAYQENNLYLSFQVLNKSKRKKEKDLIVFKESYSLNSGWALLLWCSYILVIIKQGCSCKVCPSLFHQKWRKSLLELSFFIAISISESEFFTCKHLKSLWFLIFLSITRRVKVSMEEYRFPST